MRSCWLVAASIKGSTSCSLRMRKSCRLSLISDRCGTRSTFGLLATCRGRLTNMKSMTGFGRGSAAGDESNVTVEIKTVNNRYLDIHFRLGQELAPLEMSIRKLISSRLSRGRVDLSINFERTGAPTYEINRQLIAGYVTALREIQTE